MTTKQLLEVCRYAPLEIAAINHQIGRLVSLIGPGGANFRNPTLVLPDPGCHDAEFNDFEEYMQILKDKRQEKLDLMMQFDHLLDVTPDEKDRMILKYYYGYRWTQEQISEEVGVTDRTVRERKKKAVASNPRGIVG